MQNHTNLQQGIRDGDDFVKINVPSAPKTLQKYHLFHRIFLHSADWLTLARLGVTQNYSAPKIQEVQFEGGLCLLRTDR